VSSEGNCRSIKYFFPSFCHSLCPPELIQQEISSHFDHSKESAPHRGKWSAKKYAIENNFGDPVGIFYFTSEHDPVWSAKIFDRVVAKPVEKDAPKHRKERLVVDCFTFFNELEVLKLRIKEMGPFVDHFVLVEAPWTHVGRAKPLLFEQHQSEIAELEHADKILHIVVDDMPNQNSFDENGERPDSWLNERFQRRAIDTGIKKLGLRNTDIIIISDLDEIVDIASLKANRKRISKELKVFSFRQDMYYYDITSRVRMNGSTDWLKAKALSYKMYLETGSNPERIRMWPTEKASSGLIDPGGWHLSFFGSLKTVRQKIENMAHQEFNNMAVSKDAEGLMMNTIKRADILHRSTSLFSIKHIPVKENPYLPREIKFLQKMWPGTEDLVGGGQFDEGGAANLANQKEGL
jgi:beta-1,4-mannosyl-glycoprotein beta-1,4-N-acetylglucosaminyltransferase